MTTKELEYQGRTLIARQYAKGWQICRERQDQSNTQRSSESCPTPSMKPRRSWTLTAELK